ncbi:putative 2-aminoethylphosphonate ABC transporter substrate-binding protein [Aquirhabdus parva]|uniref:Putative 2-aminoethylphosphonate ABC transporter substrate-binding protein n=1 Tax=Aquirhabdus parva TaxID=2283318 RepID=A0A345P5S8_9GAMM|nr:putative 2-aminoethylphosphonate ABC transporter substrate-binding protein [Aquirhabdus parva]AXI02637.1 putative 2-aminoethylphosphonate ABC transporter substrate-binding protein [Aquirhabdus parva]
MNSIFKHLMLTTTFTSIALSCSLATAGQITVYTALEADQLVAYEAKLKQAYPDLSVKWVRDSTGVITARLLAEKANPQADVITGLAVTSLMLMDQQNMLLPYAPKGVEKLNKLYVSPKKVPTWTGMDAWESAVCVNTVELNARKLPLPTSWADLTKPIYKGLVVMPNPASSGTGYLDVSAWLQTLGDKKGWAYMDALHQNITQYTHSGSKPCKMAAQGEAVIGISFGYRASQLKEKGAPLEIVFPKEGLGWDLEASAIVKGTKNLSDAQKFIDWSVSKEANEAYADNFAVVAYPGVAKPIKFRPANVNALMIKNNFDWAAKNRDQILAEWSKRYDSKSEPK